VIDMLGVQIVSRAVLLVFIILFPPRSWAENSERPTTLHEAAFKGEIVQVTSLLKVGEDPNGYDKFGLTPLHWAVYGNNKAGGKREDEFVKVVDTLLQHGAKPNQQQQVVTGAPIYGTTLGLAARDCSDRMVTVLLNAGADPNLPDSFTPLKYASRAGCSEIVRQLIQRGAYVNQRTNGGDTALDEIGWQGGHGFYRSHVDVVRQLLAAGANPLKREEGLRLALAQPNNRFIGRRWAKEILVLLQEAKQQQWQSGSRKSSGKISERMN
jgi:ankyrin repeat protein